MVDLKNAIAVEQTLLNHPKQSIEVMATQLQDVLQAKGGDEAVEIVTAIKTAISTSKEAEVFENKVMLVWRDITIAVGKDFDPKYTIAKEAGDGVALTGESAKNLNTLFTSMKQHIEPKTGKFRLTAPPRGRPSASAGKAGAGAGVESAVEKGEAM